MEELQADTNFYVRVYQVNIPGGPQYAGWVGDAGSESNPVTNLPTPQDEPPIGAAAIDLVITGNNYYLKSNGRSLGGEGEDGFHLRWWAPGTEEPYLIHLERTEHCPDGHNLYLMHRISATDPYDAEVQLFSNGFAYYYWDKYFWSHTALFEFRPIS
jgi:hypothetical protein